MVVVIRKKQILAVLLCLLLLAAVPGIFHHASTASVTASAQANTNWGLSFQEEGKTPVGNASADFLKQYNAYYAGDPAKKTIYLTFDAGYENGYTPAILDTLKKHNVKAAFFVVGNYINTSGVITYRPKIAIRLGASLTAGFSTISSTFMRPSTPSTSLPFTMP